MQIAEEKAVCVHCIHDHSCALFLGEWDWLSTGYISQYMQSLQICCLLYTFTISAVHVHEEWVGYVFSMQKPFHFRVGRERQKREGLKPTWASTYLIVTASHVIALVCQHSHLLEVSILPESESRTPGHGPGPSTQAAAHQIKTTHKGRFALLWILFHWMQWGWKIGKACLWKWVKDLKHLVDSVMLSVLENALGVCHMSIGNVQCCTVTVQK